MFLILLLEKYSSIFQNVHVERLGEEKKTKNILEIFLADTLKKAFPNSLVVHQPGPIKIKGINKKTAPDILFQLEKASLPVFIEVTRSSLTWSDPKRKQRRRLRLYEKENGSYRSAVLYREHFESAETLWLTFGFLESLSIGDIKTNKARKLLNSLAGKSQALPHPNMTEDFLTRLGKEVFAYSEKFL